MKAQERINIILKYLYNLNNHTALREDIHEHVLKIDGFEDDKESTHFDRVMKYLAEKGKIEKDGDLITLKYASALEIEKVIEKEEKAAKQPSGLLNFNPKAKKKGTSFF